MVKIVGSFEVENWDHWKKGFDDHAGAREKAGINTIYVGKKRVMNYVLACMTILQSGSDTVTIKARGRSISAAVDVAQILTRRFTQGVNVKSISIATEQVPNRETNELSNVSSIEIEMGK